MLLPGCGGDDSDDTWFLPSLAARLMEKERPRGALFEDTAAAQNPLALWGAIDCEQRSRHTWVPQGGDPAPKANGDPQGDAAFRRLTVFDGDDFYGERCELGRNDHRYSPVAVYGEGDHLVTWISLRLPPNYPLQTPNWQGGVQFKQAQPADNGGGTPPLSLSAFGGRWILYHSAPGFTTVDRPVWSVPASPGRWTRFAIDVLYSANPALGRIEVLVDLNGDGDFYDDDERSGQLRLNALKRETRGSDDDGYSEGDPLVSHLRAGLYHDPVIGCPAPAGCSIEIDNVQIVRADPGSSSDSR
jgi:hypothetical protein